MLSRVADTLYWLSRYIERAENNARMLDVNLQLTLDATIFNHRYTQQHWESIIYSLEDTKLFQKLYPKITGETVVEFVSFEQKNPNSIYSCFFEARENARSIRELIHAQIFSHLNRI